MVLRQASEQPKQKGEQNMFKATSAKAQNDLQRFPMAFCGSLLLSRLDSSILLITCWILIKMKRILCLGGSGQLGSKVLEVLKPHRVTNLDFSPNSNAAENVLLDSSLDSVQNNKNVLQKFAADKPQFNSILVTAGGWAGGSVKDEDYLVKTKKMLEVNLYPSMLAAHLATKYLQQNGLVIFTGAAAVFKEPQPEMLAYSIAKTGVHSLALNLSERAESFGGKVITILPEVIDTESNRQGMPDADHSKWSKPQQIGELLKSWIDGLNVPHNGSFAILKVKNGSLVTDFI